MVISQLGDIDREGNLLVPGQTLPDSSADCREHTGACLRCGTEIKSKPRRKFQGEERRQRKTISVKVPQDADEDMAGQIDDGLVELETLMGFDPPRPKGYTLANAIDFALMWLRNEIEKRGGTRG